MSVSECQLIFGTELYISMNLCTFTVQPFWTAYMLQAHHTTQQLFWTWLCAVLPLASLSCVSLCGLCVTLWHELLMLSLEHIP